MIVFQFILVFSILLGLQIPLQVVYIRKCLANSDISETKRRVWIAILVLSHLFGIIAYILVFHKRQRKEIAENLSQKLDKDIEESIFLFLVVAFEFYSVAILKSNPGNILITCLLSLALVLFIAIHYLPDKRFRTLKLVLPYIVLLILILEHYLSASDEYGFIVLICVAIIIFKYELKYIKVYFWFPLILFQAASLLRVYALQGSISQDLILEFLLSNTITYCFVAAACYFAKRQLIQNNQLNYLMQELKNKTSELEEASLIRERNRIAREIHDTLGHTLTGAIIQLEVAKKMVHKDPEKVEQSIIKTQEITRKGFADVKRAIKALRPAVIDEETLIEGLNQLIVHTANNYNFEVIPDISLPDAVSDDMKISVYRIVQELITNSIRHGNSTQMRLSIEHQSDMLRVSGLDNGNGCKTIKEGNGLRGIRERVEHLNGKVYFSSKEGEGFGALIYLPL